jgi:hypothetical protein
MTSYQSFHLAREDRITLSEDIGVILVGEEADKGEGG